MPRLIVTEAARRDLRRCRDFLRPRGPHVATRAAAAIGAKLRMLETRPHMGRPFDAAPDLREVRISFGKDGYLALYRHDPEADVVLVLAVRHGREAGY